MTLPFYPFYWGDYSSKTFDLTQGQHGAYMLFLRHIYTSGRPIPHEQRFLIAKAMLKQEQENADYVLTTYFTRDGDVWRNDRAEEVMLDRNEAHQRRVNAGKTEKNTRKQSSGNAISNASDILPNQNQNQIERKIPKEKLERIKNEVEGFSAFWESYPRRVAKGAALKAWKTAISKTSTETIIEAAKLFAGIQAGKDAEFIPHAATWLNAERWQDSDLKPQTMQHTETTAKIAAKFQVFIAKGTPQWSAWYAYRKCMVTAHDRRNPETNRIETGWSFPSEWPPGMESKNEKSKPVS